MSTGAEKIFRPARRRCWKRPRASYVAGSTRTDGPYKSRSMSRAVFIAGDWGTSRLRLYLCDRRGEVLARAEGEGASVRDCAGRFAAAVAPWDQAHGVLPAVLGGMVGSTIGWREVPYLKCPAKPGAIAGAALRFEAGGRAIAILPGLSCTGKNGAPDV